jgi:hypothetical protein
MIWAQNVFGTPVTISTTTTWSSSTTLPMGPPGNPDYRDGIIVTNSSDFTIDGITLTFRSGTSITVSSNCKLFLINSTTLTATTDWTGIVANSNSGQEQFDISGFPTKVRNNPTTWAGTLNPTKTLVMCTDAIINNAEIGIESNSGAIVRTRGGEFNNCKIGIKIGSYSSASNGDMNACFMMRTKFSWDNSVTTIWTTSVNPIGISLTSVKGINIGGCEFKNGDNTKYCTFSRGTGILGDNASFAVSQDGDQLCQDPDLGTSTNDCSVNCLAAGTPQNCKFEGLTYGIFTTGSSSTKAYRIGIRDSDFKDMLYSIVNYYAIHVLIYKCSFIATRATINLQYKNKNILGNSTCEYAPNFTVQFINNIKADAVRVVNNSTLSFDDANIIYVRMENTGNMQSLIQGNTFSNISSIAGDDEVNGIYAIGYNRHLDIKCNTFTNLSTDIYIGSDGSGGKLKDQNPTGNLHNKNQFSNTSGNNRINIFNNIAGTFIIHIGNADPDLAITGTVSFPKKPTAISCTIDNGCEGLTDELSIKNILSSGFKVYPNPAQKLINITNGLQLDNNATAHLFDLLGNKITEIDLSTSQQIDISEISNGLYFILIQNGVSVYSSKIVIQK